MVAHIYRDELSCTIDGIDVDDRDVVEVAHAPGAIHRRSAHKYAVPSNHV